MSFTESLAFLKLSHIFSVTVVCVSVCLFVCLVVHLIVGINIVCRWGGTHTSRWLGCSRQRSLCVFLPPFFAKLFYLLWSDRFQIFAEIINTVPSRSSTLLDMEQLCNIWKGSRAIHMICHVCRHVMTQLGCSWVSVHLSQHHRSCH